MDPVPATEQSLGNNNHSSIAEIPLVDLEGCEPLDIDEGVFDQLVESEMELGPIPYSPITPSILEDLFLNDSTSNERILPDPFLIGADNKENKSSGNELESSDTLILMKKDDLVCLLTSQVPSSEKIGGIFDLVIILRSYLGPEQGFGPATIPSRYCAALQYDLQTIVVHGQTANHVSLTRWKAVG
jgi:hypothetical protein